jgi:hypothetical protein
MVTMTILKDEGEPFRLEKVKEGIHEQTCCNQRGRYSSNPSDSKDLNIQVQPHSGP